MTWNGARVFWTFFRDARADLFFGDGYYIKATIGCFLKPGRIFCPRQWGDFSSLLKKVLHTVRIFSASFVVGKVQLGLGDTRSRLLHN